MEKNMLLEVFRLKTLLKVLRSLDEGMKDESVIFQRVLTYILHKGQGSQSCGDTHQRALITLCQYYLREDSSFSEEDMTSYCRILVQLRELCLEPDKKKSPDHPSLGDKT